MEQRHESATPPGPAREEVLEEVTREQRDLQQRQGSTPAADPSVRRGLPRRALVLAVAGAVIGVVIALALIPVLWNLPLLIVLGGVGAIVGGIVGTLIAGEREDGRVDDRVRR